MSNDLTDEQHADIRAIARDAKAHPSEPTVSHAIPESGAVAHDRSVACGCEPDVELIQGEPGGASVLMVWHRPGYETTITRETTS